MALLTQLNIAIEVNMDWKKLFDSKILKRGYDYFRNNAVEDIDISESSINACVFGSEDYEVEISLKSGRIKAMYCSCPYADGGENCKHMAAALYLWESLDGKSTSCEKSDNDEVLFSHARTKAQKSKKLAAINDLIEKAEAADIKKFFADALMGDGKLLLEFYKTVNKSSRASVDFCIQQIKSIVIRYSDKHGYISYKRADGFADELYEMLENEVRIMLDNGQYEAAFQVLNYIFVTICTVDIDDSDGEIRWLAAEISELWTEILDNADETVKDKMFGWFCDSLEDSPHDLMEEYIGELIMREFSEERYDAEKLRFIEGMLKSAKNEKEKYRREYAIKRWSAYYLELLESQKNNSEKLKSFYADYWSNDAVRLYYIRKCMANKEYDKAIKALDESIELDSGKRGLVIEYSQMKKAIYKQLGRKDEYITQLTELLINLESGRLDLFRELKEQYSAEEWAVKREWVFDNLPRYARVDRLYLEEKLYDRLLDCVRKSCGLRLIQEYMSVLKNIFPEELLNKYRTELEREASVSGDRNKYRHLVQLLKEMKRIKGGTKIVADIVLRWKDIYKNRPAMMDELNKL